MDYWGERMQSGYVTPIYREDGRDYFIDTCRPQRRAVQEGKIQLYGLTHGHYLGSKIPEGVLPGLSSVGFWEATGAQNWGLEPHRNEGVEISLFETGVMGFMVDGQLHRLKAGSLTVTRPWQLHCLGDPHIGPGRMHWLILDVGVRRPSQQWHWPDWLILSPSDMQELTQKIRQTNHPFWHSTPEITSIFQSIAVCLKSADVKRYESRLAIYINHLLIGLLDVLRAQAADEDPGLTSRRHTVELFLQDLAENAHALAEPWTLEYMAAQCGVGSTSFVKHCQAITNTSPMDYVNRCRLERGAQRLRDEPDTPITQIAADCGFSSSQYFATRFAAQFGVSPREYRARCFDDSQLA